MRRSVFNAVNSMTVMYAILSLPILRYILTSYILGFFGFVMVTAYLELGALHNSSIIALLIALPVGAWYVLSQIRRGIPDIDRELVFEQSTIRPFELLDLSKGN